MQAEPKPFPEPVPLRTCPACDEGELPAVGKRCTGFRGSQCTALRCSCGALNRRRTFNVVLCWECGGILPLDLVPMVVDLEEDEGPRGGRRPATTAKTLVCRNTGAVWVFAPAWPRVTDGMPFGGASRTIVEAATKYDRDPHLIGRFHNRPVAVAEKIRTFMAEVRGRPHFFTLEPHAPDASRRHPKVTIDVEAGGLLEVFTQLKAFQKWAATSPPRTPTHTELENLEESLYDLISEQFARLPLHAPDALVRNAADAFGRDWMRDQLRYSWTHHELERRFFCAGSACPGYGVLASTSNPHPETCLAAEDRTDTNGRNDPQLVEMIARDDYPRTLLRLAGGDPNILRQIDCRHLSKAGRERISKKEGASWK